MIKLQKNSVPDTHIQFQSKGPVIRATFFFNLSRNIVALQVEISVARISTLWPTCLATKHNVASWGNMLRKVDLSSTQRRLATHRTALWVNITIRWGGDRRSVN